MVDRSGKAAKPTYVHIAYQFLLKTVQSSVQINSKTTEITDPLKVFDSFSKFVKTKSNQKKLPENFPFGFSVVHNYTETSSL